MRYVDPHSALDTMRKTDDSLDKHVKPKCTNTPILCPLCPVSPRGFHKTIWKYTALEHLIVNHSDLGGEKQAVPGGMILDMFISRAEEDFMGITLAATNQMREDTGIPGSDDIDLEEYEGGRGKAKTVKKRLRAETVTLIDTSRHQRRRATTIIQSPTRV